MYDVYTLELSLIQVSRPRFPLLPSALPALKTFSPAPARLTILWGEVVSGLEWKRDRERLSGHWGAVGLFETEYEFTSLAVHALQRFRKTQTVVQSLKPCNLLRSLDEKSIEVRAEWWLMKHSFPLGKGWKNACRPCSWPAKKGEQRLDAQLAMLSG